MVVKGVFRERLIYIIIELLSQQSVYFAAMLRCNMIDTIERVVTVVLVVPDDSQFKMQGNLIILSQKILFIDATFQDEAIPGSVTYFSFPFSISSNKYHQKGHIPEKRSVPFAISSQ